MANVNRSWLIRTGTLSAGVLLVAALLVIVPVLLAVMKQRFHRLAGQAPLASE